MYASGEFWSRDRMPRTWPAAMSGMPIHRTWQRGFTAVESISLGRSADEKGFRSREFAAGVDKS